MFEEHIPTIAAFNSLFDQLMAVLAESAAPGEPIQFSEDMVYGIYRRRPPPDSTLEALIGAAFRFASMNLLFTSDVMADAGVLVAPGYTPGITTSLTPYFKAATQLSFSDYAHRVIYPYYRKTAPDVSFDQLVERESLYGLAEYLRSTPKIGLMHNADDFLLSRDDLEFLERVFGDRARNLPDRRPLRQPRVSRQRRVPDRLLHRPGPPLSGWRRALAALAPGLGPLCGCAGTPSLPPLIAAQPRLAGPPRRPR